MEKSESIMEITKAILKVMDEVKGIDKTMNVGTGNNSYKGVADQIVKKVIGESMQRNGLAIVPIGIDETTQLNEWDEVDSYSKENPKPLKRKQQIFTKVKTNYILMHSSGEWIEVVGYGHGVDSQDKSAGKATTYALKYLLLYTFLTPTGKIDDSDITHSDEIPSKKPKLTIDMPAWSKAVDYLQKGGKIAEIEAKYDVSAVKDELLKESK